MTEDQIERRVEAGMDALDRKLLSGKLTQAEYDEATSKLNDWATKLKDWVTWDRAGLEMTSEP